MTALFLRSKKWTFFYRANICFGRSALMLSGGGVLGFLHLGVVNVLLEQGLLAESHFWLKCGGSRRRVCWLVTLMMKWPILKSSRYYKMARKQKIPASYANY